MAIIKPLINFHPAAKVHREGFKFNEVTVQITVADFI